LSEGNLTDLDAAIAKVEGEHAEALRWFRDHAGQTVGWREIKDHADQGARLVTQAKGIYKPRYAGFALSVRQTLDSPYADKEVVRRDDGSWVSGGTDISFWRGPQIGAYCISKTATPTLRMTEQSLHKTVCY
jgi:hypothetical protein